MAGSKILDTEGISRIEPVPGATAEWYYGVDNAQGDLYEAEELFRAGRVIKGRKLCLVHYPEGRVFFPLPAAEGKYSEKPVFHEGGIFLPEVAFEEGRIRILRFDCESFQTSTCADLPLSSVKDCYNLQLQISPVTLSRQCVGSNEFEIVWPERVSFPMGDHDSFFLREGGKLFFSRWHEEGQGEDYRYWEETVVRDLEGNVLEIFPGDVMQMPNGEIWYVRERPRKGGTYESEETMEKAGRRSHDGVSGGIRAFLRPGGAGPGDG